MCSFSRQPFIKLNQLVNSLFIALLLINTINTKNMNYNLLFELEEEDMPDIDKFYDLYDFSDSKDFVLSSDTDDEYIEESNTIAVLGQRESNSNEMSYYNDYEIEEFITENSDEIDNLSYYDNIDFVRQYRREENELRLLGRGYRSIVAKLMIHNAFRNAPIYYEEDINL